GAAGLTANPPAASTPPTTPSSYSILPAISGSFNVGIGQTYTTLTAAIADLNSKTISGPVLFSLTSATYGSETFPIVITANSGSNNQLSNFTGAGITMTPSAGNESWTISGNTIFESGARTTALTGISFASQGTNTITQNTIRDLNTSVAVTGMQLADARATTV